MSLKRASDGFKVFFEDHARRLVPSMRSFMSREETCFFVLVK